ncbi:unnamed protein product [Meganyctiphanes norvegica]|uniref:Major facilitator superfamily (MFS) profile domain-containing protein n=1 Tax=Meganyctiphanes norvegica TaxID=48144 RepID=A0AAV2QPC3_MEGNR
MEVNEGDIHISLTGKRKESNNSRRWRYTKQALIVANASQWFLQMAMFSAWNNPASYDFIKIGTNFYGNKLEFSDTQLDMLTSLDSFGSILGSAYAWPVSWWGRRFTMMIMVVPHIIAWCLLGFSPSPTGILVGKMLSGVLMGASGLCVNTYMVEIPDVSIRGTIAMLTQLELAFGYLLTVSLGLVLRYYHFAYVGIGLSVVACALNYFIPESPTFLVTKNREEEARLLLKRLRSPDDDIELELEMIRNENKGMEENSFISVLRRPDIRKTMLIILGLFITQQFSGIYIFYINTTRIFIDAKTNMNPNLAVVFTFIAQFAGTVVGSITIEKWGRRNSIVISVFIVSIFLYMMGTYSYLNPNIGTSAIEAAKMSAETTVGNATLNGLLTTSIGSSGPSDGFTSKWQWVPLMCLMGIVFSASLGVESVPWILSAEYFPTSIRAKAQSIVMVFSGFLSMFVFGLYSPMKNALTIPGLYFFYATSCVAGFLFSLIFVRETAGQDIG